MPVVKRIGDVCRWQANAWRVSGVAVRFSRPPRDILFARSRPREDVMTNLAISELLMLTCIGTIIASVTYAVKLSIEAF